ncbi:Prolyl carboxy peptidase like protein 5 [Caenorhabditis elegans]|uniref:Prolyl carboxy peptidase like protein 5 n=1 Tax=Caenorhabditis elegans TaxID=6239 RepID=PCP5_CAEEL|nr:Prolyl carboxy peptidase like protein 5 [Caenorhabditis elegans]P34676.1 RecName: Full=Prolyl carboxy peptidase like protein 5; Flags: Precursor [Caenorhabditis elegans]CCD62538.1 Prolyl carboxy peptidase like protein 5 [Caenorhabditis elegans]|eukprot:NP_498719.1 Prolyl carboxy peptidase like protein 5 [Caenorhabditis elegans]
MNIFISLAILIATTHCLTLLRDPVTQNGASKFEKSIGKYKYEEGYLKAPIDPFAFTNDLEFDLRYFLNIDHYETGGPILFYTGNEGSLEAFAENTGFMWDLAPELKAAVVFVEHRFYGKSQPFKNESYTDIRHLGYLSSQQALADFALSVQFFKNEKIKGAQKSAVIAFGGSYGGMLSAWFRIKYPHIVDGAIAASAPVFWFTDSNIPEDVYDFIVTRAFLDAGCNRKAIEKGWIALDELAKSDSGRQYLNVLYKLDPKSKLENKDDIGFLKQYIRESMEAMAMVNYPYPTSFLSSLPAWPVKEACKSASQPGKTQEESAEQLYKIVNLYYNYTGDKSTHCANAAKCDSAYGSLGDPLGWPFQTCTEMVMPLCGSGYPNDFFWKDCPFTSEKYAEFCMQTFSSIHYNKTLLRPLAGGLAFGATSLPSASNIVFSNGYLDPWSGGGYDHSDKVQGSVISVILKQGAHHYDLRGAHPQDTEEVKKVRAMETQAIKKWIKEKARNSWRYD